MSVDRDSRDLLEALQVENRELRRRVEAHQQVTARVAALEAEVVGLKRQLELADEARDKWGARLAVIQRRDLEAHVAVLEAHVASLRRQLELADEVRDAWATDAARLRRALDDSHRAQVELRRGLGKARRARKRRKSARPP